MVGGGSMVLAVFLGFVAGCGGGGVEVQCTRAYNAACEHQIACELADDFAACDAEMRDMYVCDYSKTVEDFKLCSEAAESSCSEFMPSACFEVMCDKVLGCIETEPNDTNAEF
jgi:hypothetical protein